MICGICAGYLDRKIKYIDVGQFHPDQITIDHIVPKSRGGQDVYSNKRLVHYRCNQQKGSLLDSEMMLNV